MTELVTVGPEYDHLLRELKERIRAAQLQALRAVNREQIALYLDVGKMIVGKQSGDTWGRGVVSKLADDLSVEFPGVSGFSAANLWRMKAFYEAYGSDEKLAQRVREIGWSHNVAILEKCKDPQQREFYIQSCRRHGWTRNVLIHQIEDRAFEKTITNQTNFTNTIDAPASLHAQLAVKDEYTFAFLDLEEAHSERQLERAITSRVEKFLREMGAMFTFLGSQYKLRVAEREYFIDLLLFHRQLRALVAIELKVGEFEPEYVGKMQFYLSVLDDTVKLPEEQPSIGIILCKSKDRTIVEYALREASLPIGVASYTVTPDVPKKLEGKLPSASQIELLLEGLS